jgi:hypothetical protein
MHSVTTSDDGTRVLGYDDRAYRHLVDFDGRFSDIYIVDAASGERKLALKQLRSEFGAALLWSPDAALQAYVFAILTSLYLNDALHPGH